MIFFPNFIHLVAALIMAFVISSCGMPPSDESLDELKKAQAQDDPPSVPPDEIPAIHVVFTWEDFLQSKNLQREEYFTRVDICNKSGWPARELPADQVEKIGKGRTELFFDARLPFVRQVNWRVRNESGLDEGGDFRAKYCNLSIHEYLTGGVARASFHGERRVISVKENPNQVMEWARHGWEFLGDSMVAGQPCKRWGYRNEHEVCMWSGGKRWGFRDDPVDLRNCSSFPTIQYLGRIPLQGRLLGKKEVGCQLRVEKFTIGKGLLSETANPSGFGGDGDGDGD